MIYGGSQLYLNDCNRSKEASKKFGLIISSPIFMKRPLPGAGPEDSQELSSNDTAIERSPFFKPKPPRSETHIKSNANVSSP